MLFGVCERAFGRLLIMHGSNWYRSSLALPQGPWSLCCAPVLLSVFQQCLMLWHGLSLERFLVMLNFSVMQKSWLVLVTGNCFDCTLCFRDLQRTVCRDSSVLLALRYSRLPLCLCAV